MVGPLWSSPGARGACMRGPAGALLAAAEFLQNVGLGHHLERQNIANMPLKAEVLKHSASVRNLDCWKHSMKGPAGTCRASSGTPGDSR